MNHNHHQVYKELNRQDQEMYRNLKHYGSWTTAWLKNLNIDKYADYPKRSGKTNF